MHLPVTAATAIARSSCRTHSTFVAVLVFRQTVLILGVVLPEQHPAEGDGAAGRCNPEGKGDGTRTAQGDRLPQLVDHAGS